VHAQAQAPSLFLTLQEFQNRTAIAQHEPWAKASLEQLIREANAFPESYEKRFGLQSVELPPEGGQWLHWYVCPDTGTPLTFRPPNHNVCPDTGTEYPGPPFDQVVYQLRNDALRRGALSSALAYRFTNDQRYARTAIQILNAYADRYEGWPLHDNHGKATANGGKAYSQTLDESIWLIDIAWTYDLVRGSSLLNEHAKAHIENDLLRASCATVSKAHKEPTDNIQSWINAAIAAVGFTLKDESLIHEAIDGPIGFRYQMHDFVIQGFWIEGAFGYHFYALRALVATAQMAKRAGIDLWSQEPALLSLFQGPMGVALPNGTLPAFNDSNPVDLYAQDYLYEEAYAASMDRSFLPVMAKYGRTSREALLFGVAVVPRAQELVLKSEVFADAGYATLRNNRNDLTLIAKFGPHGGAHGHYDKLSFVLYSQGRVMGIDPGTQLYGLPLHRQWDSMTIAHNTISVDAQRQSAVTGKLIDWHTGADWVAVTMDAGPIYKDVSFQRSILLTPNYCLVADRVWSSSSHTVDWIYHNAGAITIEQPKVAEQVTDLAGQSGYGLLHDVKRSSAGGELRARFVDAPNDQTADDSNPNSPAATTRPANAGTDGTNKPLGPAVIELVMPASDHPELMTGVAPGHDLKKPVPFVLARKLGHDVSFTAVLSPVSTIKVSGGGEHTRHELRIAGPDFSDDVSVGPTLSLKAKNSSEPYRSVQGNLRSQFARASKSLPECRPFSFALLSKGNWE
jgi:hypothetical protein